MQFLSILCYIHNGGGVMDKELNEKELENTLGGANQKPLDENAFRDMFLEEKFREMRKEREGYLSDDELENTLGGANPKAVDERIQRGSTDPFRDKFLEEKFKEMHENEEKGRTR